MILNRINRLWRVCEHSAALFCRLESFRTRLARFSTQRGYRAATVDTSRSFLPYMHDTEDMQRETARIFGGIVDR